MLLPDFHPPQLKDQDFCIAKANQQIPFSQLALNRPSLSLRSEQFYSFHAARQDYLSLLLQFQTCWSTSPLPLYIGDWRFRTCNGELKRIKNTRTLSLLGSNPMGRLISVHPRGLIPYTIRFYFRETSITPPLPSKIRFCRY